MNFKKIAASLTAAACFAGVITAVPDFGGSTYAAELVHNDFEVDYGGWHEFGDYTTLTAVPGGGANGTRGMLVSGRTVIGDGAQSSKGFYLNGGVEYNYSMEVMSEKDQVFHVSLVVQDLYTEAETEIQLMTKSVKAGEWTELSTKYTAPDNSYEFRLTITTESTDDFYFDNVLVTEQRSKNEVHAASSQKGLKDEFANYFRVGNILNGGTVQNSTILADYLKDFNSIECENETKPDATLVQSGSTDTNIKVSLSRCAAIADFCSQNGIGFRGHTMVWHSQSPSWFFREGFNSNGAFVNTTTMNQRLESYIKNMFNAFETQYPNLDLFAYDVCNECVSDDSSRTGAPGWGPRVAGDNDKNHDGTSAWVSVYGDNSFVRQAFTYAKMYAPEGCKLFYNDYNEYWDHKRDCIYRMCKELYEEGVLDGVGMQSHINANWDGFSGYNNYVTAMKKYLSIGCEVQITELDISVENGTYSAQDQARKYTGIAQAAMDWNDNPEGTGRVTLYQIWGPNDANSWLSAGSNALLRDSNNNPKAAYTALSSMLPESEWGIGIPYTGPGSSGNTPTPVNLPDENGLYFHDTFEGSTNSWSGRGAASVSTSGRAAYEGSESLLVQDRTAAWNGGAKSLSSKWFKAGEKYSFSACALSLDGAASVDFKFTLQYTGSDNETYYSEIASGTALSGEWIQLANTEYEIPAGATNLQIYVETSDDSTANFYVDDVYAAIPGKVIDGPGGGRQINLGDLDFDGVITAVDISLARQGLVNSFTDSVTALVADVDQSGEFEVADVVNIQKFVLGMITAFPVAEKKIDVAKYESIFASVTTATSYKKDGENNVCWTQRFGADPGWMVYKDRLYVFTTNDAIEYNSAGQIRSIKYDSQTLNCFSTADLVNWTDHGAIPVAGKNGHNGPAKWASFAWAPDACWKTINGKDKFFLYFADSAGGIGVLTADAPEGPYTDPIGHALITKSTPGFGDVEWLFDPGVMVDDDGTGYLYCGGGVPSGKAADPGTARIVKLGADMTSLTGEYARLNPPYLFEDSSIIKVDGTYYYSYCTNWSTGGNPYGFNNAEIAVMTSSNPMGPFTYKGICLKNPASYQLDGGGNNHHSIIEFKGNYYVLYHSRHLSRAMGIVGKTDDGGDDLGANLRSTHIDKATFSNGMFTATGTMKGVDQIETLDPYTKVQAETMGNQSAGIRTTGLQDTVVTGSKGEWTEVKGVALGTNPKSITVRASSKDGAVIKVCTKSASGTAMTYVEVPAGGSMSNITSPIVTKATGTQDVYFVFSGDVSFDSWQIA